MSTLLEKVLNLEPMFVCLYINMTNKCCARCTDSAQTRWMHVSLWKYLKSKSIIKRRFGADLYWWNKSCFSKVKKVIIRRLLTKYQHSPSCCLCFPSAASCRWSTCEGSLCAWSSTRSSSPPAGSRVPNTTTSPTTAAPATRRHTSQSSGTTRWDEPTRGDAVRLIFSLFGSPLLPTQRDCKSCWVLWGHTFILFIFFRTLPFVY